MSSFWNFWADLPTAFAALAPAALGGLLTERVGYLNIALEGLIMAGAFSYIAVGSAAGPMAGILAAFLVCAVLAYLSDALSRHTGADSFVIGLGLNLLVPGVIALVSQSLFLTKGIVAVPALLLARPLATLAGKVPVIGPMFLSARWSEWLALLVVIILSVVIGKSALGLRVRALGMSPDALRMAGVNPHAVRRSAYIASGLGAAMSGIVLAASIGAWVPNISSGRGWIALVAIYLGAKRLGGTIIAVFSFTLLLAMATRAQLFGFLPAELLTALPYLLTAIVVITGSWLRTRYLAKKKAQP